MLDVQEALASVRPEWERLSDNHHLYEHVVEVQNLLKLCKAPLRIERPPKTEVCQEWFRCWKPAKIRPRTQDLLRQPLGLVLAANGEMNGNYANGGYHKSRKMINLFGFITEGKYFCDPDTDSPFERPVNYYRHVTLQGIMTFPSLDYQHFFSSTQSCLVDWIWCFVFALTLRILVPSQPMFHNPPIKKINEAQAQLRKLPTVISELSAIVNHFASNMDPVRSAYGR